MNSNASQTIETQEKAPVEATASTEYQAPAIESVFTPEEMTREVLYAGTNNPSIPL